MRNTHLFKNIAAGICILALFSCSGKSDKAAADDYEKGKISMEEVEQKNPKRFLTVTGKSKKNVLGQTVIKGSVKSSAKIVSYKDVEIKLSFFSKTGALLEEDRETVYETIAPGAEADFKSKYFAPKGTDSVGFQVISAKL